jgi:hypothetical protein
MDIRQFRGQSPQHPQNILYHALTMQLIIKIPVYLQVYLRPLLCLYCFTSFKLAQRLSFQLSDALVVGAAV